MSKRFKLSVCIPTYNRASFIADTIQSIINAAKGFSGIEIVVSDNASIDNTKEIVDSFRTEFPDINYFRWTKNMGADLNYLKVVELARGDYCWLFGSDDLMGKDAIAKILGMLEDEFDVYLVDRMECDINMKPKFHRKWLKTGNKDFFFENDSDLKIYFENSLSLGAVFSYITSIIVKRDKWEQILDKNAAVGTAYAHVYVIMSILQKYPSSIRYISEPLILCRLGNDSFAIEGEIKRFLLDIDGYIFLSEKLEFNNNLKKFFLEILKREHSTLRVVKMIVLNKVQQINSNEEMLYKLNRVGFSNILLTFAKVCPYFVIKLLRSIKKVKL